MWTTSIRLKYVFWPICSLNVSQVSIFHRHFHFQIKWITIGWLYLDNCEIDRSCIVLRIIPLTDVINRRCAPIGCNCIVRRSEVHCLMCLHGYWRCGHLHPVGWRWRWGERDEERGDIFSIHPSCCFLLLFLSYPDFQSTINHVKIASHTLEHRFTHKHTHNTLKHACSHTSKRRQTHNASFLEFSVIRIQAFSNY